MAQPGGLNVGLCPASSFKDVVDKMVSCVLNDADSGRSTDTCARVYAVMELESRSLRSSLGRFIKTVTHRRLTARKHAYRLHHGMLNYPSYTGWTKKMHSFKRAASLESFSVK